MRVFKTILSILSAISGGLAALAVLRGVGYRLFSPPLSAGGAEFGFAAAGTVLLVLPGIILFRRRTLARTVYFLAVGIVAVFVQFFQGDDFMYGKAGRMERGSGQILSAALQPGRAGISVLIVQNSPSVWPERIAALDWVTMVDCIQPGVGRMAEANGRVLLNPELRPRYDLAVILDELPAGKMAYYGMRGATVIRLPYSESDRKRGVRLPGGDDYYVYGSVATGDVGKLSEIFDALTPGLPENCFTVLVSDGEYSGDDAEAAGEVIAEEENETAENEDVEIKTAGKYFSWWWSILAGTGYLVLRLLLGRKGYWNYRLSGWELGLSGAALAWLMVFACRRIDIFDFMFLPAGLLVAAMIFADLRLRCRVWETLIGLLLGGAFFLRLPAWGYGLLALALTQFESAAMSDLFRRLTGKAEEKLSRQIEWFAAGGLLTGLLGGTVLFGNAFYPEIVNAAIVRSGDIRNMLLCFAGFIFFRLFYLLKL